MSARNTRANPNRNQEVIQLTRQTRETRALNIPFQGNIIPAPNFDELDLFIADADQQQNIQDIVNQAFNSFFEWYTDNEIRLQDLNNLQNNILSSTIGQSINVTKMIYLPADTNISLGGINNRYFLAYYMFELLKYTQNQILQNLYNPFSSFYGLQYNGFQFRYIMVIENNGEDLINFGYNGDYIQVHSLRDNINDYFFFYFLNYNVLSNIENEFNFEFAPNELFQDSTIYLSYLEYINSIFVKYDGNVHGSDPELNDFPGHRIIFKLQIILPPPIVITVYNFNQIEESIIRFGPRRYSNINLFRHERIHQNLQNIRTSRNGNNTANNRIGGKIFQNATTIVKSTIFQTNYLQEIPFTRENMCFIMSIFTSQVRKVKLDNDDLEIIDSTFHEDSCIHIKCNQVIKNYPISKFLKQVITEESIDYYFIFGNNTDLVPSEIPLLLKVCKLFHQDVERHFGHSINYCNEVDISTFYSEYLGFSIHIYDYHFKNRKKVYANRPFHQNISVHLYVYIENEHSYGIKNILSFLSSKLTLNHHLCDFCQLKMSNFRKEKCIRHIKKCFGSNSFINPQILSFTNSLDGTKKYSIYERDYKRKEEHIYNCKLCGKEFYSDTLHKNHICTINFNNQSKEIKDTQIFCLDIESCQDISDSKYEHKCVLICVKQVYSENIKFQFRTMEEFCIFIEGNENFFHKAIFLAHNGGGYDYHFLVVELEKRNKIFTKIPKPNSEHKYLEIKWDVSSTTYIRFIDFMMFVPGSLKNIAQSFQIKCQKGDFPHKFLNSKTIHYIGPLPEIDNEKDYFCISNKKTMEEKEEVLSFHKNLTAKYCYCKDCNCNLDPCIHCNKPKWNCYDFLVEYCWLDVEVLGSCIIEYRQFLLNMEKVECCFWTPEPIEPFQCVTQSQLAMQIFSSGWKNSIHKKDHDIYLNKCIKTSINWKSIHWLESLQNSYQNKIQHAGNCSERVYFPSIQFYADGYCSITRTVFIFCNSFETSYILGEKEKKFFEEKGIEIVTETDHVYDQNIPEIEDVEEYKVYSDREIFYGGRTEVFSAFLDAEKSNSTIHYHDVCSLYPYVCCFKKLPHGKPIFLYKDKIEPERLSKNHERAYFGFAKIKVKCNKKDYLGLLPSRDEQGKLVFTLYDKIGFWHTEEIYLAVENGYEIEKIYQVIHFEEDSVTDTLFRGYMAYFLKIKMESEGWKKLGASCDNPSDEEKEFVIEKNYAGNGNIARISKEKVNKNPVKRMIAKIFLNCLWGKLCQDINTNFYCDIDNLNDFQYLFFKSKLDVNKMTFREYGTKYGLKVKYELDQRCFAPNKKYNIFISSSVTAHARCILHKKMLEVGPSNVLYCDTDSVIFITPKEKIIKAGSCLGEWTNEYPNQTIKRFYAIAPKFYSLVFEDEVTIKSKGIWLTQRNKEKLKEINFRELLNGIISHENHEIKLDNMTIFPNTTDNNFPYATVFTRYNEKKVSAVISKRQLLLTRVSEEKNSYDIENFNRIEFYPFGYENEMN
jgi:hypothetical protein